MYLKVCVHEGEVWDPHQAFDEGTRIGNRIPGLRVVRRIDHL